MYRLRYSEHNYFLAYKANSILKIWLLSLELYACLILTFIFYCWQWLILQAKHFNWFDRVLASCLNWVEATLSPQLGWVVGSTSIWGIRPVWLLLVAADGLWQWAILGLVGLRNLLLQSVVRAHLLSVQRVCNLKGLQSRTVCLGNLPERAFEVLKLIPDYIFQYPESVFGFLIGLRMVIK